MQVRKLQNKKCGLATEFLSEFCTYRNADLTDNLADGIVCDPEVIHQRVGSCPVILGTSILQTLCQLSEVSCSFTLLVFALILSSTRLRIPWYI
ncbi:hypothetical protein DPMN_036785 [Dreissena polymorpha]|uniref:Uncharacterized protein n=1 Tax=Dreissena polymorpha TaxID=45954 RepID=A0A9D4M9R5_DREPO|nr:hypothetical protein DPMN_036785 [Dreissena polymorpha]